MTSNSPVMRFAWIRRLMYRRFPDDLRPSRFATNMGHVGTLLELGVPIVLLAGHGDIVTLVGLAMMLALHGFITSNVPMAVPLEWNFMMVYGGLFLFGVHSEASLFAMTWPVAVLVVTMCVVVPLLGNLFPERVPFLLAMRYYAGNWAYSVWFFRGESYRKLDKLKKSAPWVYDQLDRFYPRSEGVGMFGKVIAFRLRAGRAARHHGRSAAARSRDASLAHSRREERAHGRGARESE
jgi:hypothetical protein